MNPAAESLAKTLARIQSKFCNPDNPSFDVEMARLRRRKWWDRCKERGVPERLHDLVSGGKDANGYRFDPKTEAIQSVVAAVNDKRRFIILSGPPGTGKTTALAYLLTAPDHQFTYGGEFGCFVSAREMFDEYGNAKPVYRTGWMPLVIDDLGVEKDKRKDAIEDLLESRYDHNCTTFISTNLDKHGITSAYSERLLSRFGEVGLFIPVYETVRPGEF